MTASISVGSQWIADTRALETAESVKVITEVVAECVAVLWSPGTTVTPAPAHTRPQGKDWRKGGQPLTPTWRVGGGGLGTRSGGQPPGMATAGALE